MNCNTFKIRFYLSYHVFQPNYMCLWRRKRIKRENVIKMMGQWYGLGGDVVGLEVTDGSWVWDDRKVEFRTRDVMSFPIFIFV